MVSVLSDQSYAGNLSTVIQVLNTAILCMSTFTAGVSFLLVSSIIRRTRSARVIDRDRLFLDEEKKAEVDLLSFKCLR